MKKLSILLLAVFYIGIANVSAQTDATTETITAVEEVQEATNTEDGKLICPKTGKICDPASCKSKSKCCKGKSKCCKGKKSKKGSFNFNKSNNYGAKSSCSKAKTEQKAGGDDAEAEEGGDDAEAEEEVAPTDE